MEVVFGETEFHGDFMVQRVSIIDSITGIKWSGHAKSVVGENLPIPVNNMVEYIMDAVASARRGVEINRVYRLNNCLLSIRLVESSDPFINASKIYMEIIRENKVLYNVALHPHL